MFQKIFTPLLLLIVAITAMPLDARADTWGANMAAALEKQALEKMEKEIWVAAETAAKTAAISIVNDSISMLLTGRNGRSLVIQNPYDHLYGGPSRSAKRSMDNFFSVTARGRDSADNYHAFGTSGTGGKVSFESDLVNNARRVIGSTGNSKGEKMDFRNYCPPDPRNTFANGDFRCFSALTSNPYNNPFGYNIAAKKAYQEEYNRQSKIASDTLIANKGLKNVTDSKGNVITPGSFVFEVQVGSLTLPLNMLANADGGVQTFALAATTAIMKGVIEQGIGMARNKVMQEINSPLQRVHNQTIGKVGNFVKIAPGSSTLPNSLDAYKDGSGVPTLSSGNHAGSTGTGSTSGIAKTPPGGGTDTSASGECTKGEDNCYCTGLGSGPCYYGDPTPPSPTPDPVECDPDVDTNCYCPGPNLTCYVQ